MAEGAGAYFYTGDPAIQIEVAREKAARQLGALSTMTGAGGRILGEYRRQKEEAENVALQNRKLNAALGRATAEAQAESNQSLADPLPEERNALQRVASGALDFVKTGLKTTANTFGFGDPHLNAQVMQQAQENAALTGQLEREKGDVSLMGAVNPIAAYAKHPGQIYGKITGGRINIGDPEMVDRTAGSTGGLLSAAVRDAMAAERNPDVARAIGRVNKDKRDLTQPTQAWVPADPYEKQAMVTLVRFWKEKHPEDLRTFEEIAQSTTIPQDMVKDLADQLHAQDKPFWGAMHNRDENGELIPPTPEEATTSTPSSSSSTTMTGTTLPSQEGRGDSGAAGDAYIQTRSGRKFKIGTSQ